jgi:hypothetical protein
MFHTRQHKNPTDKNAKWVYRKNRIPKHEPIKKMSHSLELWDHSELHPELTPNSCSDRSRNLVLETAEGRAGTATFWSRFFFFRPDSIFNIQRKAVYPRNPPAGRAPAGAGRPRPDRSRCGKGGHQSTTQAIGRKKGPASRRGLSGGGSVCAHRQAQGFPETGQVEGQRTSRFLFGAGKENDPAGSLRRDTPPALQKCRCGNGMPREEIGAGDRRRYISACPGKERGDRLFEL